MSTIDDVAKRAGVSKTTVSRFLNGKAVGNMKVETLNKIKNAIQELNYQPNTLARSLKSKESKAIGLIVPDITNPFFPAMVKGAEDFLKENGYSLFLLNAENAQEQIASLESLRSRKVDGIILVGVDIPIEQIKEKVDPETRLVFIERHNDNDEDLLDTVITDNYSGAYEGVKHLIDLGLKNIIHVSGREDSRAATVRTKAFIHCLSDHGLEISSDSIIQGNFSMEESYKITRKLIAEKKLPDAIFYANDFMACGGIRAFIENEIRIPEDISILGYDDIYVSSIMTPGLTTVHQPVYEMGKCAGELLLKKFNGKVKNEEKQNILLKPKLVIRKSTRVEVKI